MSSSRIETQDGIRAVELARSVIETEVAGRSAPDAGDLFQDLGGAFVTILTYPEGDLRGCIGYPYPVCPLRTAIRDSAVSACHDPRFPDLSADEIDRITVEVTILTSPETIDGDIESSIAIGRDGLMIEYLGHRGLLLPQVAVEYGFDARAFLDQTCMKAGLPPGSWREDDAVVKRFSGEIFSETEPHGDIIRRDFDGYREGHLRKGVHQRRAALRRDRDMRRQDRDRRQPGPRR